ncbi:hypothetical protein RB653_006363 [Dictyostelium firmibasis]|uniref:Uncharacterized protein n=1 Tax=Dictyostelium firmibasis TaxID=79012 RepID=A0AAN7YY49_9MYCE
MSYAEIVTINSPPLNHIDEETTSFIELLKTSNAKYENFNDRLEAYSKEIDKYCELINDANLTAYQRNNDHFPVTFEFPGASKEVLEAKKLELSKFKIPLENLFISKGKRARIHALIKHESSLADVLDNRAKLGSFYTSSRDFHVLTGSIKIKEEKVETVKKTINAVTPLNTPFSFYHSKYLNGHLSIFGLIEYKRDDKITNINSSTYNFKTSIRCATRAIYNEKKFKASSTENGKVEIKASATTAETKPAHSGKKKANKKKNKKVSPSEKESSTVITPPAPTQAPTTQNTSTQKNSSQMVSESIPPTLLSTLGDLIDSCDTEDEQTNPQTSGTTTSQSSTLPSKNAGKQYQ